MAGKVVFLVEGEDDAHVLVNICGRHQIGPIDQVIQLKGVEQLARKLPIHIRDSEISALGVLLDADADAQTRWMDVCRLLKNAGYADLPFQLSPAGTIVEPLEDDDLPRFGVWVMPNNEARGMLEDFLQELIPAEDVLLPCAVQAVDSLPVRHFKPAYRSKALIHTWLAWQEEPGKPYGQAIKACYLDSGTDQGQAFTVWLETLLR